MFGPVSMNQRGLHQPQFPQRRDPFIGQRHSQLRPNHSALNNQFFPAVSRQTLTQSKGIGGLTKILDNTQQVLRMVETATPMIKEYGPMIKNLPAMYKMIKAFKDIDSVTETTEDGKKEEEKKITDDIAKPVNKEQHEQLQKETASPVKIGLSTPKLYI